MSLDESVNDVSILFYIFVSMYVSCTILFLSNCIDIFQQGAIPQLYIHFLNVNLMFHITHVLTCFYGPFTSDMSISSY